MSAHGRPEALGHQARSVQGNPVTALRTTSRRPAMTAFLIWFAHFMLCWVAVEIWPSDSRANQLAWVFTAMALLAMGLHFARFERRPAQGQLGEFSHRFARGAIAIATVAILFTAIPSLVFLP